MRTTEELSVDSGKRPADVWVLTSPHWLTVFVALSAVISLAPFIVGFVLGLSVSSDTVFGFYALISGLCTDLIFKRKIYRRLLIWPKPPISFMYFWLVLCLFVMVMRPFDG